MASFFVLVFLGKFMVNLEYLFKRAINQPRSLPLDGDMALLYVF